MAATLVTAPTSTWTIDAAHTTAEFAVRHLMISTVKGHFTEVTGTIDLDEQNLSASRVRVDIPVATISTRSAQRDEHLRSADFFDAARFPLMTFESRTVRPVAPRRFQVLGELTIRGVSRDVVLDVIEEGRGIDPWGNEKIAYSASTVIDRTAFGLTWNAALETGGVLVGNEVRIQLEIQAVRA